VALKVLLVDGWSPFARDGMPKLGPSVRARGEGSGVRGVSFRRFASSSFHLHSTYIATMSVILETSVGDITVDLLVDDAPNACKK
jgi:hypothetical protein